MPRIARLILPGATYHCIARGNDRQAVFRDDADRQLYLKLWAQAVPRFHLIMHAFALMTNHVHFLLETLAGDLGAAFHWVHGSYAAYFNLRHGRTGHLFEERYKSYWVRTDAYFQNSSIYINKNPVKAGLARRAWDYLWSSARALAGIESAPAWLQTRKTLEIVGGFSGFREHCLSEATDAELEEVRKEVLGPEGYAIGRVLDGMAPDADVIAPRGQPFISGERIMQALKGAAAGSGEDKGLAIFLLREISGLPLSEVAQLFDISPAAVSRQVGRTRESILTNPQSLKNARLIVSAGSRM